MSIAKKITLSIASCCIILAVLLSSVSLYKTTSMVSDKSSKLIEKTITEEGEEFEDCLSSASSSIDILEETIKSSIDLSKTHDDAYMNNLVESLKPSVNGIAKSNENIFNFLVLFDTSINPNHHSIWINDPNTDGNFVEVDASVRYTLDPSNQKQSWYFECIKNKQSVWMTPYTDETTGKPVVTYYKPIYKDNALLGVLMIDILLDKVQNRILNNKPLANGSFALVDNDLNIVIHKDLKGNLSDLDSKSLGNLKDTVSNNKQGYVEYNNKKNLLYYYKLSSNWSLVALENYNDIFQDVRKTSIFLLLIAIVLVSIACFIGVYVSKSITKNLKKVVTLIHSTSELDLNYYKEFEDLTNNKDETGDIARSVMHLRVNLRDIVSSIKKSSSETLNSSTTLNESNKEMLDSIQAVSATMEQLSAGVQQNTVDTESASSKLISLGDKITSVVTLSNDVTKKSIAVKDDTDNCFESLEDLSSKMDVNSNITISIINKVDSLNEKSQFISSILTTIQTIATQTNLLALNAAIEAARAGEHGKGFSVVADEIRKLSEQTTDSAKEIDNLLGEIKLEVESTKEGMDTMTSSSNDVTSSVVTLKGSIKNIDDSFALVSDNLNTLMTEINYINKYKNDVINNIEGISATSQEFAASSEEISASLDQGINEMNNIVSITDTLKELVNNLEDLSSKFKI
ncbi:methyl-accepting chemotaxis protein [Clostridium frigidicarnis]|uniref:Methyl-accepting chemotaxis sensory transducer with Cache sensor n=1 Tax=Clostridium frigidicarnis TaxID=84698 RepID=A0A1I0WB76_9CLOT|nr:methyl-accepting chemotaxis protein [Clostridium frigidicarnis]SFA85263.1 methyl-accepting chemotaxis sensory transducer with Cache sensor [Clostridium frigidicarnis]